MKSRCAMGARLAPFGPPHAVGRKKKKTMPLSLLARRELA